eukprot:Skav220299  [mRNA]  locus=scaffold3050:51:1292:- [translate_table: standard]
MNGIRHVALQDAAEEKRDREPEAEAENDEEVRRTPRATSQALAELRSVLSQLHEAKKRMAAEATRRFVVLGERRVVF